MKAYIVAELIYGNEGNPNIRAFTTRAKRDKIARQLKAENELGSGEPGSAASEENPDVLIVRQTIEIED